MEILGSRPDTKYVAWWRNNGLDLYLLIIDKSIHKSNLFRIIREIQNILRTRICTVQIRQQHDSLERHHMLYTFVIGEFEDIFHLRLFVDIGTRLLGPLYDGCCFFTIEQ